MVAEFCDCRQIRQLLPFSATVAVSATVAEFGDKLLNFTNFTKTATVAEFGVYSRQCGQSKKRGRESFHIRP